MKATRAAKIASRMVSFWKSVENFSTRASASWETRKLLVAIWFTAMGGERLIYYSYPSYRIKSLVYENLVGRGYTVVEVNGWFTIAW